MAPTDHTSPAAIDNSAALFGRPAPAAVPDMTAASGLVPADRVPEDATVRPGGSRPQIETLLQGLVEEGGSDLHLAVGEVPRYRIRGDLKPVEGVEALTADHLETILREAVAHTSGGLKRWDSFVANKELDYAYPMVQAKGSAFDARFRANYFVALGEQGAVFRVIPDKIKTLAELGVPQIIKTFAKAPRGLIWITGPTGSGKSTTGAALLDAMNETRSDRIFTIEDPVEFTHQSKRCLVSHREVGTDTESFEGALRAVRREDPDIIYIGEVRDNETLEAAIEAADTGHLVIATLHTSSAPETITRIINSFPEGKQEQIRVTLASNIIAVVCQTLVKSTDGGRVAACEIMVATPAIRNNIRQNDIPSIANAMTDTNDGSMLLDKHLADLVKEGKVKETDARRKAQDVSTFNRYLGSSATARR